MRDNGDNNTAQWTDKDKDKLERLRTAPVTIGDTAYEQFEEQMKRDAGLAYEKMTPEQRLAGIRFLCPGFVLVLDPG